MSCGCFEMEEAQNSQNPKRNHNSKNHDQDDDS